MCWCDARGCVAPVLIAWELILVPLGSLGALWELFWLVAGVLAIPGRPWAVLGGSSGGSEASLGTAGRLWGVRGRSLGVLGRSLGVPGASLGWSWRVSGGFWGSLGRSWGASGIPKVIPGAYLSVPGKLQNH